MCGIYATNLAIASDRVRQNLEKIKYRGPDYTGVQKVHDITFGHLRLAILDLEERSNQPFVYESYSVVFNGEIYNYLEIKEELENLGYQFTTKSDTEVLLKAYIKWGEDFVCKLNGMFAFVIYDATKNTILAARDRLGVKPLYYFFNGSGFEICSQLTPMISKRNIDEEAISIYLNTSWIPAPYSMYKEVKKLMPGSTLKIDLTTNLIETKAYWELSKVKPNKITYTEAKKQLKELIKDAVRIRLNSDVPIGSFLSGGIDSCLITAIAAEISDNKVNSFSIGFDNPEYDESIVANQFAEILKTEHNLVFCNEEDILKMIPNFCNYYDEPFGDSSALPSLLLNKMAKEKVTVALSGDGGDESFMGYNSFDSIRKTEFVFKAPVLIRRALANFLSYLPKKWQHTRLLKLLRMNSISELIEGTYVSSNNIILGKSKKWLNNYRKYLLLSDDNFQRLADLTTLLWLPNDSNVKVDRASMASSVEVRSPFLDYRIIEFARELPRGYKYDGKTRKKILRDILSDYVPEKVFNQPKKGFSIPMKDWIRTELKMEFDKRITIEFLSKVPNLNISKFQKMYKRHMLGEANYSSIIWRVYVLALWDSENNKL
jgi:asparagine synthase (glutamine-hydrolysing)